MSVLGLVCLLLALLAAALAYLVWRQRRDLRSTGIFFDELRRAGAEANKATPQRLEVESHSPPVQDATALVNRIIQRAEHVEQRDENAAQLFGACADRVHESVIVHRERILFVNQQFAALVGIEREQLIGRSLDELVAPEYSDFLRDNFRHRLAGEPAAERFEIEIVGFQAQLSRLEVSSQPIAWDGGVALLVTAVEIVATGQVDANPDQDLSRGAADSQSALYDPGSIVIAGEPQQLLALRSIAEAIATTDTVGCVEYVNPAAERLLGVDAAGASGRSLGDLLGLVGEPENRSLSEPILRAIATGQPAMLGRRAVTVARQDGSERAIEMSAAPMRDAAGEVVGAVLLLHDVTELRGMARQMSYQATHDALTGLINRREFERRLDEAVATARRGDSTHVLCYIDLDRFKAVNDTSGHLAGDSLLREVAKLLREAVRDSDTVARLGGDEFGMLLTGCPLEKARQIADDVCRAIAEYRFVWKDQVFNVGASIGLLELARESGTIEESLAAADSACYVAKKQGAGQVAVYSARDEARARQSGEIQWLQKLQVALRDETFVLYQQPIVPAANGAGAGPAFEVLLRLPDANGKIWQPREFLRAAERYRLMGHIDRWVVRRTLQMLGSGAMSIGEENSVSINISGQTLGDVGFLEYVVECLDSSGVVPSKVCFEMTESAVVANLEHAKRFASVLHGMGCRFALDDFGSGVGSFSNLKNLPLDYLKIDGSFTKSLARDTVNQAMVNAMIKLGRTLNFKVIAEEIEDAAALDMARRMGVDFVQGHVIAKARPLPNAA